MAAAVVSPVRTAAPSAPSNIRRSYEALGRSRQPGRVTPQCFVAAMGPDPAAIVPEAADLLYHLLVLLADADLRGNLRDRPEYPLS